MCSPGSHCNNLCVLDVRTRAHSFLSGGRLDVRQTAGHAHCWHFPSAPHLTFTKKPTQKECQAQILRQDARCGLCFKCRVQSCWLQLCQCMASSGTGKSHSFLRTHSVNLGVQSQEQKVPAKECRQLQVLCYYSILGYLMGRRTG